MKSDDTTIKVKDVIEILQKFDPDKEVRLRTRQIQIKKERFEQLYVDVINFEYE